MSQTTINRQKRSDEMRVVQARLDRIMHVAKANSKLRDTQARLDETKALAKKARLALADHDLRLVRNLLMLIEAT